MSLPVPPDPASGPGEPPPASLYPQPAAEPFGEPAPLAPRVPTEHPGANGLGSANGASAEAPAPPGVAVEPPVTPQEAGGAKSLLREIIETVLLTVAIYLAVNFATARFRIEGSSMEPSLHPNEYVLVDKVSYMLGDPQRGDVVVFNFPLATERDFIKRVIGLPGETVTVAGGLVSVNGEPLTEPYIAAAPNYEGSWTLGPDEYFVLGDNRNSSSDSRSWGPLARHYLIGRAALIYWPPELWGFVPHYTYANGK